MFDPAHVRDLLEEARTAYHDNRGDNANYAAKFDDALAQALDALAATDHAVNVVGSEV